VLATLRDNTGAGKHTGTARGFDSFSSGSIFVKGQKSVPSTRHNNKLLAELVMLKLNIAMSELEITPAGFGQLQFVETGNPLDGNLVTEIAAIADEAVMGVHRRINSMTWTRDYPYGSAGFENLYNVVKSINDGFDGDVDSLAFGVRTQLTGVLSCRYVPFMQESGLKAVTRTPNLSGLEELPSTVTLSQNYPNPFNPTTTIEFALPEDAMVTLKVYNLLGQEVATLANNELFTTGRNSVTFNAKNLASGVYFYRLTANVTDEESLQNNFTQIKKMLLLK
jgi:hypothetical protein